MRLMCWVKRVLNRHPDGPSDEALVARAEARVIRQRADTIYVDREELLRRNHFAERIRLSYEGR